MTTAADIPTLPQVLSPTDQRMIGYLRAGMTNEEIVAASGWTYGSVRVYVSQVCRKTGWSRSEFQERYEREMLADPEIRAIIRERALGIRRPQQG